MLTLATAPMRVTNTATQIANALQTSIMLGELRANDPLRQDGIAKQFGVSKIPVREALQKLEGAGLVSYLPNGSATVSALSPADANEIYLLRIATEQLLIRHAIPNIQPIDLVKAENTLRLTNYEIHPNRWSELNWDFHAALYNPANLPLVMQNLAQWYTNVSRYFVIYDGLTFRDKSQKEHDSLLEACREKDVEKACAILDEHLRTSADLLIDYLSS